MVKRKNKEGRIKFKILERGDSVILDQVTREAWLRRWPVSKKQR